MHDDTTGSGTARRKTRFFDSSPAPDEAVANRQYQELLRTVHPRKVVDHDLRSRVQTRLLLGEGPMHLTEVRMAPGTQVPRHRHGADQIVIVREGSLWQGNRELRAGAGFFTPAGAAYGFRAGPEGATFHEFFFGAVEEWAPEVIEDDA